MYVSRSLAPSRFQSTKPNPILIFIAMQGLDSGLSQISKKGTTGGGEVVWNMPLDIIYKSTNAHGWPRLVVSVRPPPPHPLFCVPPPTHRHVLAAPSQVNGFDVFGRTIVVGYGSMLVPPSPGRYRRVIRLFRPVSSTVLQSFIAWLTANQPEFWDPRIVSQGKGREGEEEEEKKKGEDRCSLRFARSTYSLLAFAAQ